MQPRKAEVKSLKRYIYILRHGETEYGREKRYLGHIDCDLSEVGVNKAKELADIFANKKIIIDNIFSSDLRRCKRTVNLIFPERKVIYLDELREINMGDWDGLTFKDIEKAYPVDFKKRGENIADFTPKNGESFRQCQSRAIRTFNKILNSTTGNIAICSHAGFIRTLISSLLKIELKNIFNIKQDYGCINIIACSGDAISVIGINERKL